MIILFEAKSRSSVFLRINREEKSDKLPVFNRELTFEEANRQHLFRVRLPLDTHS